MGVAFLNAVPQRRETAHGALPVPGKRGRRTGSAGKVIGGTRAAEEGPGAVSETHRGQVQPAPSHGRTARAPPPGVPAGRAAAPPARGRAGPSADRPRRAAAGAAAHQSFSSAAARPRGFTLGPRRVSPDGIPPSPPSSPLPAAAMLPHLAVLLLAAGAARALEVSGAGSSGRGASPPPSTASPKLCLSAAAPTAWAWPRRGRRALPS